MLTESIYKDISEKLFKLFFVDENKYGRQLESGSYRLVREKLSLVTIDDMLLNHKSLLTYQESHTLNKAFIKWICIDLDISKKEIDQNEVNVENLALVKSCADDICSVLNKEKIPYLLEFSGRRGFHIWVVFEKIQSKEFGFLLVNYILSKVNLPPTINADKFPKTRGVNKNTKMVGFGVKLPLSQNKGSKKLSFFLKDSSDFIYDKEAWPSKASDSFLIKQFEIMNSFHPLTEDRIIEINSILEEAVSMETKTIETAYLKNTSAIIRPGNNSKLDSIITSLSKCDYMRASLENYQLGMSGRDRSLMVGILGNLSSEENPDLGYDLLLELFSGIKGYRKDLTEEKIRFAKSYFPITCSELGRCSHCTCKPISSPVELIEGITLRQNPSFQIKNISEKEFERLKLSLKKYSLINDEIPLFHLLAKIENSSYIEIKEEIERIFKGEANPSSEVYFFERNEGDKIRILHSLNHINNIVSTYFLYILNSLFYTEISDNSYGYKLAPGLFGANIFGNWFVNWGTFSKKISHVLYSQEFSEYYLVKIDIKSFYDRIDLQRLKIKLYEEAPFTLKEKLSSLSPGDKIRYKYIIDYLITISRNSTKDHENGLPQGPAYARFLAELYLLGLDRVIEEEILKDKKREFYYRFVDDIFIFVEDRDKAHKVLKSIDKWIQINNLELNPSKSEVVSVIDYVDSGKFKRFQDDAKYMINKANKNKAILSDSEIRDALSKLGSLTNDIKFGLKDNLRFFYYQFTGDKRLNSIKDKLINFLPYTDNGRGTLYMMFYNDLIANQKEKFWNISSNSEKLRGLSLGHYLNTILLNESDSINFSSELITLINDLTKRENLTDADKALIITISKRHNLELNSTFLNSCSKALIYSAMETPNIRYTISDFKFIEEKLEEKDIKGFVKELYRIIIQHSLDSDLAEKISSYALTRFSEWSQNDGFSQILNEEVCILEYYHALCFFSLFNNSSDNAALIQAWDNLLSKSLTIHLSGPLTFEWLNRAVEYPSEDFSHKSHYTILLSNIEGSSLNHKCEHGFLKQFQNILLVLLFSKNIQLENFGNDGKDNLHNDSIFKAWLENVNVRLYPSEKNICVRNLALNGIIVLENDTDIFIKRINDEGVLQTFEHLIPSNTFENEIELKKDNVLEIYEAAETFQSLLTKISEFISYSISFMENYKLSYPVYYKRPFSEGNIPLIPFYSQFPNKVSNFGSVQVNDTLAFWENIFYIIQINNKDLALIAGSNCSYNYTISELEERFFPKSKSLIESTQDKLDFLNEFVESSRHSNIKTYHEFQFYWSTSVWNLLQKKKKRTNIAEFLSVHFANFQPLNQMPNDILFGVNERTIIDDENLSKFIGTIRIAILDFQSQQSFMASTITDILDEETKIIEEFFQSQRKIDASDFKRATLTFKDVLDQSSGEATLKVQIGGEIINNKEILTFNREPIAFDAKKLDELSSEIKNGYAYCYMNEEEVLVYLPESEMVRAFERIKERKEFYDSNPGLDPKYKELFPIDNNYVLAENNYADADFAEIEKKLENHYSDSRSIRTRVVSWLSLFNASNLENSKFAHFLAEKNITINKVHRFIMKLLSSHHSISKVALEEFEKSIREFSSNEDYILFPLKHPDRDKNGLYRMLKKCNFKDREINFDKYARDLFTQDCENKTSVIIVDTTISGTQATTALEFYLKEHKTAKEFDAARKKLNTSQKFFDCLNFEESKKFIENWGKIKKAIIITPIITDTFITKMESVPFFRDKDIEFRYTNILSEKAYNWEKAGLDPVMEEIVKNLIEDVDLIDKLFVIPNREEYEKSIKKISAQNILLRIGSLPSRHIKLFSLQPRSGVSSLLDYVPNWNIL